jgi:ketosteroid isomerase-like protein
VVSILKNRLIATLVILVPGLFANRAEAQVAPEQCAAAEYRQFDFWLGDWEVRDKNGQIEGMNQITTDHNGCVLTEHWSSPGQTGISLNMYDFRTKNWTQSWYDSNGNLLIISGTYQNGSMTLQGSRLTPEGQSVVERCRWTPLPDGRVHQYWDFSPDGGMMWKPRFEGFYSRRKEQPMNPSTPDETRLRELNQQYIDAFMKADVSWYQQHLAEDFVCIESTGTLLNKQAFLQNTAEGPDVLNYRLEQVNLRIHGSVALVQGTGVFTRKDGSTGKSLYIDVYFRKDNDWKAVSAQNTRTKTIDR